MYKLLVCCCLNLIITTEKGKGTSGTPGDSPVSAVLMFRKEPARPPTTSTERTSTCSPSATSPSQSSTSSKPAFACSLSLEWWRSSKSRQRSVISQHMLEEQEGGAGEGSGGGVGRGNGSGRGGCTKIWGKKMFKLGQLCSLQKVLVGL